MLICIPIVVVVSGIILVTGMMELAALMNQTIISPVVALVKAAQRIAANDFSRRTCRCRMRTSWGTGACVQQDEIRDRRVHYGAGRKRKTLDLLHEEELEKLETEKRLEMIKLELLKSQINPHFCSTR